ncbi:MAG: hypothetical protein IKD76_06190 [Clostridia bacterium]|nr:hypothetical protein [Clostridia bacterium]
MARSENKTSSGGKEGMRLYMEKVSNYPLAYKEVYVILKNMDEDAVKQIPKKFIEMLELNMDKDYEFTMDKNIDFEEKQLLQETKGILAYIFMNYWATQKQYERVMKVFNQDMLEEQKKQSYNPNNLFKNQKNKNKQEDIAKQKETQMIEYKKPNILVRIFGKIINLFKKR